ncbi:MAG: universal stress protein [Theionarchaea archaeon]|nr:universal stress protein [Theionarchaea archaeon]MBU6999177.1 universal stress protein [Theionarchaea archaeon]MBU7019698.1 universal stress protein [Theionarchaea archaeon]MBU7034409.1 universal stress protein [Theionarchaea archaeon]MBU7041252.1 universal stress protein [Theionarchaea archaeon]
MKILICIRKSECRHNALEVGGKLVRATNSEATVLFVSPKPPERFEEYFEADVDLKGRSLGERVEQSRIVDQRLLKEAKDFLTGLRVKAQVKLRQGDPVKETILESVEGKYDLIIVGSRALHGIKARFESFSERLIEHASIPVLVASHVSTLSSILLCVEGTEQSRITIEYARDFAKAIDAHVTVMTVAGQKKDMEKAQRIVQYAESILKEAGVSVETTIRVGNPTEEIHNESIKYDLVLVGSHKPGILETLLLKSPSIDIVESSKAPTLVVRDEPE